MKRVTIAWALLMTAGCQFMDAGTAGPSIQPFPTANWKLEAFTAKSPVAELADLTSDSSILPASAKLLPPTDITMKSGLPPASVERTIDLQAALTSAGLDNPTVALALEAVRASEGSNCKPTPCFCQR